MKIEKAFNFTAQFAIPFLTVSTYVAIALKLPQWGLIINLIAQPFWLYSAYKGYKKAGQLGLFITIIIVTMVIIFGIINYWFL